jgi:hypothetical protein
MTEVTMKFKVPYVIDEETLESYLLDLLNFAGKEMYIENPSVRYEWKGETVDINLYSYSRG